MFKLGFASHNIGEMSRNCILKCKTFTCGQVQSIYCIQMTPINCVSLSQIKLFPRGPECQSAVPSYKELMSFNKY